MCPYSQREIGIEASSLVHVQKLFLTTGEKKRSYTSNPAFFHNVKYEYQCGFRKLKVVTPGRTQNEQITSPVQFEIWPKKSTLHWCV